MKARLPRRAVGALAVVAAALAVAASPALAQSLPSFSAPVVDQAKVVPDAAETRVAAGLEDYRRRSGNQVAVAVVKTTGKKSIEDYSIDLAREWGVGTKDKDNGVLLVIAFDDRKLRIEVGRGLEGTLTDLDSGRIIRERLVPLLRNRDVGAAVAQGTDAIRLDLGDTQVGALPPLPPADEPSSGGGAWPLLAIAGMGGLVAMGSMFSGRRRRGFAAGPIFIGGGWGHGGGWGGGGFGGGGGGGGFGGGGGGGFGGGGASGGW